MHSASCTRCIGGSPNIAANPAFFKHNNNKNNNNKNNNNNNNREDHVIT